MVVYLKSETNYEYFGEQVRLVRVSLEIRRSTGCNYRNSSAPVVRNGSESDRANSTRKIRDKFSRCTRGSRSLHHSHELNRSIEAVDLRTTNAAVQCTLDKPTLTQPYQHLISGRGNKRLHKFQVNPQSTLEGGNHQP